VVAPALCQIANAGKSYLAWFLAQLFGGRFIYLPDSFLADAKLASKFIERCARNAPDNDSLFPGREFA